MKTLRLLRNLAALFIFGAALVVPRPSVGQATARHSHGHCVRTLTLHNCTISGHQCVTTFCLSSSCNFSVCANGK
jgi:hypothetical protein